MSSMSSAQIVSLFYSSQDQAAKDKALASLTQAQIASLQNIQNAKASGVGGGHHHPVPPHHAAATHVANAAAGLAALGLAAPQPGGAPYTPSHVSLDFELVLLMFCGFDAGSGLVMLKEHLRKVA